MDVSVEIHCAACGSASSWSARGRCRRWRRRLQRLRPPPRHLAASRPSCSSRRWPIRPRRCGRDLEWLRRDEGRAAPLDRAGGRPLQSAFSETVPLALPRPPDPAARARHSPRPRDRRPRTAARAGVSAEDRLVHERMLVLDTHLDIPARWDDGRWDFGRAIATTGTSARSTCRAWRKAASMAASSSSTPPRAR